jgi:hypothetical protein
VLGRLWTLRCADLDGFCRIGRFSRRLRALNSAACGKADACRAGQRKTN